MLKLSTSGKSRVRRTSHDPLLACGLTIVAKEFSGSLRFSGTVAWMTALRPTTPRSHASERSVLKDLPTITRVSWRAAADMDYVSWAREGGRIGALARGSAWWLGDWLHFGTAKWGDRYAKAARITGYDAKTLRNMRYVASRFPPSLRRDNLSWSHHALVTGHTPEQRTYWLDRATQDGFSVEDLRMELRRAKKELEVKESPGGRVADTVARRAPDEGICGAIRCPQCGSQLETRLAP